MGKPVFIPVSLGASLIAGLIGKRLFGVIWGVIDDEQPPKPGRQTPTAGGSEDPPAGPVVDDPLPARARFSATGRPTTG
jgi:hypothetical protein